jgi:hypothetical protein
MLGGEGKPGKDADPPADPKRDDQELGEEAADDDVLEGDEDAEGAAEGDDEFPEVDDDLIDLDDEWDEKDLDEDEPHDKPKKFYE